MRHWNRFHIFTVPVLLALVLSAFVSSTAFADDGPPPAPPDSPSGAGSTSSNSSSDDASSGQSAGTHQAADDSRRHTALARQQAAGLEVNGDPQWCPTGVAPRATHTGGCSASFSDLSSLVGGFVPTGNGTIWVKTGPALAGVQIDGSGGWSAAKNFKLTIQGGWNGHNFSMGLAKANPSDPYPLSYFSGNGTDTLWITNWVGNVTLKNLTFNSDLYNNLSNIDQLLVQTQGNITLDRVQVFNALNVGGGLNDGARLDNASGAGSIKVTNSQFVHNQGMGLQAYSNGSVTLQNVQADLNGVGTFVDGVFVDNTTSPFARPVVVSNSEFDGNGYRGLEISSRGAIILSSLTAQDNTARGVLAYNNNPGFHGPITMNGANNFSHNGVFGISLYSNGPIKISKVTANFNAGTGVFLDNSGAGLPMAVTILGFLTALGNGDTGLEVISQGTVSSARLTTSNNAVYGTYIDNTFAPLGLPRAVMLSGVNVSSGNVADGLHILSDGAIVVSRLTAQGNAGEGAYLNNTSSAFQLPVTIAGYGTFLRNGFGGGLHSGLEVWSHGALTLANLNANGNYGDGAILHTQGLTAPQSFTLIGHSNFNFNGWGGPAGSGLEVYNDGKIFASNIIASYNFGAGADLDNVGAWTGTGFTRSLVNLGGVNKFIGNFSNMGLYVNANGAIVLSHVTANENGSYGILLHAGFSPNEPVTIVCSSARNNVTYALAVVNASVITLKGWTESSPPNDFLNGSPVIYKPCP